MLSLTLGLSSPTALQRPSGLVLIGPFTVIFPTTVLRGA
jgi:hypothetical protein